MGSDPSLPDIMVGCQPRRRQRPINYSLRLQQRRLKCTMRALHHVSRNRNAQRVCCIMYPQILLCVMRVCAICASYHVSTCTVMPNACAVSSIEIQWSKIGCCRSSVLSSSTNKNAPRSAVPSNRSFCGSQTEVRLGWNNHNSNFHRHIPYQTCCYSCQCCKDNFRLF